MADDIQARNAPDVTLGGVHLYRPESFPDLFAWSAKTHYVYVLYRENGAPFYVGKGVGNRALRHEQLAAIGKDGGNPHRFRIIADMQRRIVLVHKKVAVFPTNAAAISAEIALIAAIGREPSGTLVNLTKGGDGVIELSRDAYDRMVAAQTVAFNRPEERAARSLRSKALHADPARKAKHAAGVVAAYANPEMRARQSAAVGAANRRPEARLRVSAQANAQHGDPDYKERHRASMRAACSTPEARARLTAACNARWAKVRAARTNG